MLYRCTDLLNGYTCSCDAGYTGQNCGENINECALTRLTTEPCKNGGFCVDGVSGGASNLENPDEMPLNAAFHQDLHCLQRPKSLFRERSTIFWGNHNL